MRHVRVRGARVVACLLGGAVVAGAGAAWALDDSLSGAFRVRSNLEHTVSGRINTTYMGLDNGSDSGGVIGNDPRHWSHLRLKGRTMDGYGPGYSWGYKTEIRLNYNGLNNYDLSDSPIDDDWEISKAEGWWLSPYGKVWMGRGSGAASKADRRNLLGAAAIVNNDFRHLESAPFRRASGAATNLTGGQLFPFRGQEIADRIRYITPTFGGVRVGASYAPETDQQELEVRYQGGVNYDGASPLQGSGYGADASVGVIRNSVVGFEDYDYVLLGSGSVRSPAGVGVTLGYSNGHPKDSGVHTNWTAFSQVGVDRGRHSVAATYALARGADEFALGKIEGWLWALCYVLDMDPYTVGLAYMNMAADPTDSAAESIDDIRSYMLNFQVAF